MRAVVCVVSFLSAFTATVFIAGPSSPSGAATTVYEELVPLSTSAPMQDIPARAVAVASSDVPGQWPTIASTACKRTLNSTRDLSYSCYPTNPKCGVVLTAIIPAGASNSDKTFQLTETYAQALEVKSMAHMQLFRVAVITNEPKADAYFKVLAGDKPTAVDVVVVKDGVPSNKPFDTLPHSPFERTLYINTTMKMAGHQVGVAPATFFFDILRNFDALMPIQSQWDSPKHEAWFNEKALEVRLPTNTTEQQYNPTLIFFVKSPCMMEFFASWRRNHVERRCDDPANGVIPNAGEQCSLPEAVRRSFARVMAISAQTCVDDRWGWDPCVTRRKRKKLLYCMRCDRVTPLWTKAHPSFQF